MKDPGLYPGLFYDACMNFNNIATARLSSQQIDHTSFNDPKMLVAYMGAMQAQDYEMSKWAVGVRLKETAVSAVQAAIDKGEIIRTHVMRPTWHLVSSDDVYWMLGLTAARIKASMRSRLKELELDEATLKRTRNILAKALAGNKHLTRDEIGALFTKAKIDTSDNRLSHIMLNAELEMLVCSGADNGKKQTYALLEERAPKTKLLSKEESLAELAKRYFTSHGPATLADYIWWSGLSITEAKQGLEMVKSDLSSEVIGDAEYFFDQKRIKAKSKTSIHLLPAFDEFLISYKDRTASLQLKDQTNTISQNGIFYPVIVMNGQVAGLWKRAVKKDKIIIEISFFQKTTKQMKAELENAADGFAGFLGKKKEVIFARA